MQSYRSTRRVHADRITEVRESAIEGNRILVTEDGSEFDLSQGILANSPPDAIAPGGIYVRHEDGHVSIWRPEDFRSSFTTA